MRQCSHCEGFVPAQTNECPHCDAKLSVEAPAPPERLFGKWGMGKKLTAAASAGAMMFTMMACYGMPPCQMEDKDKDGVGVCVDQSNWSRTQQDCDDTNAEIYPGAQDPAGDGVDQNCDGVDGDSQSSSGTP